MAERSEWATKTGVQASSPGETQPALRVALVAQGEEGSLEAS